MEIMNYCKAIKADGTQCKKKANSSGYCSIHDPKEIERRKKTDEEKNQKRKPLYDILTIVTETLKNNGWGWTTDNIDEATFSTACLLINKYISHGSNEITAALHVQLNMDHTVRWFVEKTSFYGYGLEALRYSIVNAFDKNGYTSPKKDKMVNEETIQLQTIFSNFDSFAKQLLVRHDNRSSIKVIDEYDVQDLLHALLKIHFKDIRREEYSPSRSGANSRVDFLLYDENIFIETKMVRAGLSDKELSEQLIIDKERYKSHPKCKKVYCFVYNPLLLLKNPVGIEKDLTESISGYEFKVYIYPK